MPSTAACAELLTAPAALRAGQPGLAQPRIEDATLVDDLVAACRLQDRAHQIAAQVAAATRAGSRVLGAALANDQPPDPQTWIALLTLGCTTDEQHQAGPRPPAAPGAGDPAITFTWPSSAS